MVHAGCVLVAGIHTSRTWISGSFEPVRWNACVHRLDLGLYSHPKSFGGIESETMLTSREKSSLLEKSSSEEDRTHNAASCRTVSLTHYQLSYSSSIIIIFTIFITLYVMDIDQHFQLNLQSNSNPVTYWTETVNHYHPHLKHNH